MTWNWEQKDWPEFRWDSEALKTMEAQFQLKSGILIGSIKHIPEKDKTLLIIDMITSEAIKTSEIENEFLNRDSVQSSIRRNFGLDTDNRRVDPAERGIAEMITDLYNHFDKPLTHEFLFQWHKMITSGRADLEEIGKYRTSHEPMQVVSNSLEEIEVHFEAPPSNQLEGEMEVFVQWFADTAPGGPKELPAITRAGIAHMYFVCIHPFEDGNGRIARGIAEKALSQSLGQPTLIALSLIIESKRKDYYRSLELNNKDMEITDWLQYFGETILNAQEYTQDTIDFLLEKTKFYDRYRDRLNERQAKVVARIFKEGLGGFKDGLNRDKYAKISGAPTATATRDLAELVEIGAFTKTGELKGTRYHLALKEQAAAERA